LGQSDLAFLHARGRGIRTGLRLRQCGVALGILQFGNQLAVMHYVAHVHVEALHLATYLGADFHLGGSLERDGTGCRDGLMDILPFGGCGFRVVGCGVFDLPDHTEDDKRQEDAAYPEAAFQASAPAPGFEVCFFQGE
jgi:hypothetical protein